MHKYKCLIVDDEAVAQRIIANYLNELPDFEIIDTALNGIAAISILEKETIDLMFLDIEMPKLKGLAFLKTLKNPPHVIITTAHREYALESFDLEAIDYLLKPISFERFLKAINRFKKISHHGTSSRDSSSTSEADILYVKSERKTIKLRLSDIIYIESMNNYIVIHLEERKHIVYSSISDILEKLNATFVRIHKSYVVNKREVHAFSKEQVSVGIIDLPIGKSYKQVLNVL